MNKLSEAQGMVREFHETFGLVVRDTPGGVEKETHRRRRRLILEEVIEYDLACIDGDVVAVADAIGDMLYVVLGTAVEHGIDIGPVFDEIHRSNMSKVGGYKDEHGKWIKPATYSPANLAPLIEAMRAKS